ARRAVVDALRRRAFHRLAQDRAVDHAGHLHVDAVLRRAVDLGRHIDALRVLTDQPELGGCNRWHADFGRVCRDFRETHDLAVADPAARFLVHDVARYRRELSGRNAPVIGNAVQEDLAYLRAELPQVVEIAGDGRAARGVLLASEQRIAVELA